MGNSKEFIAHLDLIRKGDEQALTQLLEAELPRVYNLCLKLCRKKEDAEDLCQDTFVRAIKAIKNFKGDSALSTWLYRITVNTWKNRVRHETRRFFGMHFSISGQNSDGEDREDAFNLPDSSPLPEETLGKKEEYNQAYAALNRLKPEDKLIIVLKDVEQKSYEEIGEIVGIGVGTVKSRLSRARDHFRETFHTMGAKQK